MQIIDDILTSEEADHIERAIINDRFPWFLQAGDSTVTPDIAELYKNDKNVKDHFQFVHDAIVWNNTLQSFYKSKYSKLCQKTLDRFMQRTGYANWESYDILRSKINLTPQYKNAKYGYGVPHTDDKEPHVVILYYVNDSDGDTFLFDNDNKVQHRVAPKKGRFLVFDGNRKHAGSHPYYSNYRAVINSNIRFR